LLQLQRLCVVERCKRALLGEVGRGPAEPGERVKMGVYDGFAGFVC